MATTPVTPTLSVTDAFTAYEAAQTSVTNDLSAQPALDQKATAATAAAAAGVAQTTTDQAARDSAVDTLVAALQATKTGA